MRRCFLFLLLPIISFFFVDSSTCQAQDAMSVVPGELSSSAHEKARDRYEYFYNRLTYPNGSIPVGARTKAFHYAQENMHLWKPHTNGNTIQSGTDWKNVGPFNIGGRIFALALNPKNPSTMFVGAADGGIWRSYDEGMHWESVSDALPTQSMGSIVINPIDTSVIYAGTGDASFGSRSFDGGGVFKSTDGGSTWDEVGAGSLPQYARISDMAMNPHNPDILYVAVPDGIQDANQIGLWRSKDAGVTWSLILTGKMTDIVIDPKNPDVLYTVSSVMFGGSTAVREGMYKTIDGGDTWAQLDIGVPASSIGRTGIALCADQPEVVYISISNLTGDERTPLLGIFKSVNAGTTWTKLDVPFDYMVSQGWFDNVIAVHPHNPNIVYAGAVKLIRTSDGGKTWQRMPDQLTGGPIHVDQHEIEFNPVNSDKVFVGNDGGLFFGTQDATRWEKRDLGLSITQFIGGSMHPTSDAFLFGGTQDNGTLVSEKEPNFNLVLYGDGGNTVVHQGMPNVLYTTQERVKLWRSEDFGQTWTWAVGNLPNEQSLFYVAYALDQSNPYTLYFSTYNMYKTTDAGKNWLQTQRCLFPTANSSCYYITAMEIAPYDSRTVLAAAPGAIGISTNSGNSWNIVSGQVPVATVSSVRTFSAGTIYATISRYGVDKVWRSTDFGNTWASINGNLPDIPANDIVELEGKLILGTDLGCFISENGGTEWQRFGTGMPTVSVQKLIYHEATGTLRAITHGRGIFDLEWNTPASAIPKFLSQPNTVTLQSGQPFLYAPVVSGWPRPTFTLTSGPSEATIDPVYGTVRWKGGDIVGNFTVVATNNEGSTEQKFSVYTADVTLPHWEIISPMQMNTAVNQLFCASDNSLWMTRDTGWVSISTDEGRVWQHIKLSVTDASVLGVYAFDWNTAIVGTGGPQSLVNTGSGHLLKTTDGGATWRSVLYGIDSRFGNIQFWNANEGIAVSQGANDSADVFITNDGGETWQLQTQRPFARIPLYGTLYFTDRMNGWFASSNEYAPANSNNASTLHTTDGGMTWTEQSAGAGVRSISDLAFLDVNTGFYADEMLLRVRKTTNGGTQWRASFFPMNGLRNIAVHADPIRNAVWVINDTSAWYSTDQGSTWNGTELINIGPLAAATFSENGTGWVVSKTGIVQKMFASPITSDQTPETVPMFALGDAYPNPVDKDADCMTIEFSTGKTSGIALRVYNASGQVLETLFDGNMSAGEYRTSWNTSHFTNGVYFISLASGNEIVSKRIVITR